MEKVFYTLKQYLFSSLVYFSILSLPLKKTSALYLQAVLFPHHFLLTYCVLATTFIILLKLFVHRISKATPLPNSVTYGIIHKELLPNLLKHCIFVIFLTAPGIDCAVYVSELLLK